MGPHWQPTHFLFFLLSLLHTRVCFAPLLNSCGRLLQEFTCGRRTCRTRRESVSVHRHPLDRTKMDPRSLTVPTIPFPLSPIPFPLSSTPTPVPSLLNLTSM